MEPRKVGDRAEETLRNAWGTIIGVYPFTGAGGTYYEYELEWDDGDYAGERYGKGERYGEGELLPIPVD